MLAIALMLATVIGLALGALGGGGSILTLPMLVYILHVDAKEAIAASLFVVGVTSVVGLIGHGRAGRVHWKAGALFGLAGMGGAALGAEVAPHVPGTLLLILFAVMMLLTAASMLRPRRAKPAETKEEPPATDELSAQTQPPRALSIPKATLLGAAVGFVSGLVGAGGGFLVVPALVLVAGLTMPEAVGTSLLVIAMQALAGFAAHARHTPFQVDLLAVLVAGASAGSLIGVRIARLASPLALRRAFGSMVLVIGMLVLGLELPSALRPAALVLLVVLALGAGAAALLRFIKRRAPEARSPLAHASPRK
jgi:uncharacterized membrane protein YfcA